MTRAPSFRVVSVHMWLQEKLKHPSCVASLQLCHLAASSQSLLWTVQHIGDPERKSDDGEWIPNITKQLKNKIKMIDTIWY